MNWFVGSIPDAITEARKQNKVFLVYIEGQDDMSKQMTATYNDPIVVDKLSPSRVVPLKLTANSPLYLQFTAIFPVLVIPSTFFIGKDGQPIEIATGGLDSAQFLKKVDSVFEIFFESGKETAEAPSTSQDQPSPPKSPAVDAPSTSGDAPSGESTEAKLPLEDRLERAKAVIEIRKQEKMREEKEKLKQEELERRNTGRAMQEAEKLKKDMELQDIMRNRAKDKEEERLAREAVRAQIAQDRAERAARYQLTKEAEQGERERQAQLREEQDRAARNAAMCSNEARLQFRLPDGSCTSHAFTADATLGEARQFVITHVRPPFSNFTFCTTFPRRHFTESNYAETLRDLQLAPSAVLLILPAQAVANIGGGNSVGFLSNIFWILVSPFTSIWRFLSSFFGSGAPPQPNPDPTPPTHVAPTTSQASDRTATPSNSSQAAMRRREGNFSKREGNVFRINNQSDDDENNTWNGNSTQQM